MPAYTGAGWDMTFCEECQTVWQFPITRGGKDSSASDCDKYPGVPSFKKPRKTCPDCIEKKEIAA